MENRKECSKNCHYNIKMENWEERSKNRQIELCTPEMINWSTFDKSDADHTKAFIAVALYQYAAQEKDYVLKPEHKEVVEEIFEQLKSIYEKDYSPQFRANYTELHGVLANDKPFRSVVFRIQISSHVKFIDVDARIYNTWDAFLKENKLPPAKYYYPLDGIYRSNAIIEFNESPSTKSGIVDYTKKGITRVLNVGAAVGPLISVNPATMAVTMLAAVWGAIQAIQGLRDRSSHGQSLALNKWAAVKLWLNLVLSILSARVTTLRMVFTTGRPPWDFLRNLADRFREPTTWEEFRRFFSQILDFLQNKLPYMERKSILPL